MLRLAASDTQLSRSADVTITVSPQNLPPQVSAGPAQTLRLPSTATLAGVVSDDGLPAGGQLTQAWSLVSGPGAATFNDATLLAPVVTFSAAGTYVLQLTASDSALSASAQVTITAQAAAVLDPALSSQSNRGTDFWLAFLEQPQNIFEGPSRFDLLISCDHDSNGTISMPAKPVEGFGGGGGYSVGYSVKAGRTTTVRVPAGTYGADGATSSGIHVTADQPVSVCGMLYYPYACDAFLALPTCLLGKEHLVLSYSDGLSGGSQFAVVATADATVLTITPAQTIKTENSRGEARDRLAGVPYSITLDQGQVYELRNTLEGGDVTGTIISSNLPVALFGGHQIIGIPVGAVAANYLIEQIPPTSLSGQGVPDVSVGDPDGR